MAQDRTRIEGMIIGHELTPAPSPANWKKRATHTQIEWFPPPRRSCSASIAVADERVATVPAGATTVVPARPCELADAPFSRLNRARQRQRRPPARGRFASLGKVWPSEEETTEVTEAKPTRSLRTRTPASRPYRSWRP